MMDLPDLAVFESRRFVWKHIFGDIIKKLAEDVVQHEEVDEIRRILLICGSDVFNHDVRDVLQLFAVAPQLIKEIQEVAPILICFHPRNRIVGVIAALAADSNRGELCDGHIGGLVYVHKAHHVFLRDVGFEYCFTTHPVRALLCDGALRQLIAKLDFKIRAV